MLTATSCFDAYDLTFWEDGKYIVQTDPGDPMCKVLYLSKEKSGIPRIDCISKIGSNDKYIIGQSEDKKYWLLDKSKDNWRLYQDEIVEGPLTLEQFETRKKDLSISTLTFTTYF